MREASVPEKDRVDVQIQRDRELKKGGKVTRMEEEAKELGKVMIKLCIQAESKRAPPGTRRLRGRPLDVSSARCARLPSFLIVSFTLADMSHSLKLY